MEEQAILAPADILLPNCNLSKWSVIACDQFTAQPGYWRRVDRFVGDAPSSLRLILPEANIHAEQEDAALRKIHAAMESYLGEKLFYSCPHSMVYVERETSDGAIRRGLVCSIDLSQYDYRKNSVSLIRATEETVEDRIPARVRIRSGAALELPHILMLLDDSTQPLITPLSRETTVMEKLYSFSLMEGGGQIMGWRLTEQQNTALIEKLMQLQKNTDLLLAVGDGNHSLAAAKAMYERDKEQTSPEKWAALPSRWALAEVVSIGEPAVEFLPIHRVAFGVRPEHMISVLEDFATAQKGNKYPKQTLHWQYKNCHGCVTVPHPVQELSVQTLQDFLSAYLQCNGGTVDYIHDDAALTELSNQTMAVGFSMPAFPKKELFSYIREKGPLPRKTFSIGAGKDKRYYLEARRIQR